MTPAHIISKGIMGPAQIGVLHMNPTVRFLRPGEPPKSLILPSFEASTVHDVLMLGGVGGGKVPDDYSATVNGKTSAPGAPVRPGDTVALQPNADHA